MVKVCGEGSLKGLRLLNEFEKDIGTRLYWEH